MNKPPALILFIAASVPFGGCTDSMPRRDTVSHQTDESPRTGATQRSGGYGYGGTHSPDESSRGDEPDVVNNDPGDDTPMLEDSKKPDPTPVSSGEAPYAEGVPGRYGLVYSPFVKNRDALVNVTDVNNVLLPPGTEVIDPHSGKIFRVP
jgi:hypothetical protein